MYVGREDFLGLSSDDLGEYGPDIVMTSFNANSGWIDYVRSRVG
jgi:hypothetical protein